MKKKMSQKPDQDFYSVRIFLFILWQSLSKDYLLSNGGMTSGLVEASGE